MLHPALQRIVIITVLSRSRPPMADHAGAMRKASARLPSSSRRTTNAKVRWRQCWAMRAAGVPNLGSIPGGRATTDGTPVCPARRARGKHAFCRHRRRWRIGYRNATKKLRSLRCADIQSQAVQH